MNKVIVIVPHYNHSNTIEHVVQQVLRQHLPVLIVDDGSAETHVAVLKTLQHTPNVFVHYCPTNGGKGAAMKIGFMKAAEMGFTHGIQVDYLPEPFTSPQNNQNLTSETNPLRYATSSHSAPSGNQESVGVETSVTCFHANTSSGAVFN